MEEKKDSLPEEVDTLIKDMGFEKDEEEKQYKMPVVPDRPLKTTRSEDIRVDVIRTYCPTCGAELKAMGPTMYSPYTGEHHAYHPCERCDVVYDLDKAYPSVEYVDRESGEKIDAYTL